MTNLKIKTEPGEAKCYDCNELLVASTDLAALLAVVESPCPLCESERVGYIRPLDWLQCPCGAKAAIA